MEKLSPATGRREGKLLVKSFKKPLFLPISCTYLEVQGTYQQFSRTINGWYAPAFKDRKLLVLAVIAAI